MISYSRVGGRPAPPDGEHLEVADDGTFHLWRSIGWATVPPTAVGRFGGTIEQADLTRLARAAERAQAAGSLHVPTSADSPEEIIEAGHATARIGIHDVPTDPWGELALELRRHVGELTRLPVAAVGVRLDGGDVVRLEHLGDGPARIDLRELTLRLVLWRGAVPSAEWTSPTPPAGLDDEVETKPGWSLTVPVGHALGVRSGDELTVYAFFSLYDGDVRVRVAAQSSWSVP